METVVVAVGIFLAPRAAVSEDDPVGVLVREWYAKMEGDLRSNGDILGGSNISLGNDLGLDHSVWSPEVQVYGQIPGFGRLIGGWWRIHREGDEILTRTVTFNDQTFTASSEVKSDVTLDVGYLTYEYVFPSIPLNDEIRWDLGLEVGARLMGGRGSISSAFESGSDSGFIGTPVLGGHAGLELTPYVRADVELVGMAFAYSGNRAVYLEASGEVVAEPFSWAFAGLGYKYVALRAKSSVNSTDFDLNLHLTGLYLTAGIRF